MFMFALDYGEKHGVTCDWCDEQAGAAIYTMLPVQHACDEHLAGWLIGQADAFAGAETVE